VVQNKTMQVVGDWQSPDEFEKIAHANKPFSLRVPALIVTRGNDGKLNLMLCMWFTPMGAEPSSFLVAVDRKTKSYDLMMETKEFVIAAPDQSMLDVTLYSGATSGHNEDKWAACGLTPLQPSFVKVPLVREALANVELTVSRILPFDGRYVLVVGLVQACHVKSAYFNNGIYKEEADPLLWLGKASGESLGNKAATFFAAKMGGIRTADPTSPLLSRIAKKKAS
jgi:flavin reductase (DIM6/NTAB) family NADH-FMN oxidoreductase RutF